MSISKPKPNKVVESISVEEFYESYGQALNLRLVTDERTLQRNTIRDRGLNRPALALTGHFKYFGNKRIQLLGAGEMAFFREQTTKRREEILHAMIKRKVPCIVVSRNLAPTPEMPGFLEEAGIPLFRTALTSKAFTAEATHLLEEHFAPRCTLHGTLLDIRGIGTLIQGDSGSGKSEAALALIERGHSLVADDAVRVKLLSDHTPVGTAAEEQRGYMECRGIGIINVAELFGIRFIRIEKRIDLVVSFVEDEPTAEVDRTGLERHTLDILGAAVPHMKIPLRAGRDMARLVEVAAMVRAARFLGHDSSKEFNQKLLEKLSGQESS